MLQLIRTLRMDSFDHRLDMHALTDTELGIVNCKETRHLGKQVS